ncbi:hypothetical protein [Gracilimonas sp.]|uniref:hypothetical protein n=1 Tax=Gracilimonas sp. TaxID=1974203 RepID=UPI003BAA58F8
MDNFPFGSGQGTFGSYPVNYSYSDVYRSYNLSNVHGLSKDSALRRNNKPNYLLDTYWSSILGENGFIGGIIYFILYFFPVILIKKKAGTHSKHNQVLFYLVFAITGLLFIESLVLSMLSQMTFILLYAGVPGLIYNQLKSNYL